MSKKELELYALELFKEHYKDFPIGTLIQDESPDFVIVNNNISIGIEVAEVFQDLSVDNKGSYLKSLESKHELTGQTLIKAIKKYSDRNFIMDIEFSIHNDFANSQINDIVKDCLIPCVEFVMNNSKGFIRIYRHRNDLPKEVDSIYIQILKEDTVYSNGQGGTVANLEYKHIENILSKHEKGLISYKPCKEHWLLIREGNYHAGSFNDVVIETPINSKFDKVFIIRTRHREVFILK